MSGNTSRERLNNFTAHECYKIFLGHQIKFKDTEVLTKTAGYVDRLIKEATDI
jgi:hypothetical protein